MSEASASPLRAVVVAAVVAVPLMIVLIAASAGAVIASLVGIVTPHGAAPSAVVNATGIGWPWGQCTWYVAIRRAQIGEPVTWGGDAWQWLLNATAQGVPESSTPAPGEIVVYGRGGSYDHRSGHVAFVISATTTGYTVAEANYYGLGVIDMRSIMWPDPQVRGFIR